MKAKDQELRIQTVCLLVLTTIVTAAAFSWLAPIMIPLILAVFLTFCLAPVIDCQVRRLRFPRWLAFLSTAMCAVVVLLLFGLVISESVNQISANADSYRNRFEDLLRGAQPGITIEFLGIQWHRTPEQLLKLISEGMPAVVSTVIGALASILSNGVLVLIFVMFMIAGKATGSGSGLPGGFWGEVERGIKRYTISKLALSIITGMLVGVSLAVLGIELAFVFGFFAFMLNFIPSVGSVIATLLPLPVVLVDPELSSAVKVLAFVIPGGIQFAIGNFIEPKMLGESMNLHPITILIALIFFGMLWGVVGMLLAAPIAAIIRILCDRLAITKPVAEIMAGRLHALSAGTPEPAG